MKIHQIEQMESDLRKARLEIFQLKAEVKRLLAKLEHQNSSLKIDNEMDAGG